MVPKVNSKREKRFGILKSEAYNAEGCSVGEVYHITGTSGERTAQRGWEWWGARTSSQVAR